MEEPGPRDVVQSLERGLAVLLAFEGASAGLTAAEVALRAGVSRPAARRLLLTLGKAGYVRAEGPRWSLTPRVLRLAAAYLSSQSLRQLAQPHLERLTAAIGESCSLGTLDGLDVVIVARVRTRRILRVDLEVGTRLPATASSMGRVLLAALPAGRLDALLGGAALPAPTARTITAPAALRAELDRVRGQGWCLVDQELEEGCGRSRVR